jgi:hypothetical protein
MKSLFVLFFATLLTIVGARRHYNSGAIESAPRPTIES